MGNTLTLFAPKESDIPGKHSSIASWCLAKAGSTVRRCLLAPTPARYSQSFPSLRPAQLGETLPTGTMEKVGGSILSYWSLLVTGLKYAL